MIYRTDVTLDYWCQSKGISVKSGRCSSCNTSLDTIIPVETKHGYGLIAESSCCDKPRPPYTFVIKDEQFDVEVLVDVMNSVLTE